MTVNVEDLMHDAIQKMTAINSQVQRCHAAKDEIQRVLGQATAVEEVSSALMDIDTRVGTVQAEINQKIEDANEAYNDIYEAEAARVTEILASTKSLFTDIDSRLNTLIKDIGTQEEFFNIQDEADASHAESTESDFAGLAENAASFLEDFAESSNSAIQQLAEEDAQHFFDALSEAIDSVATRTFDQAIDPLRVYSEELVDRLRNLQETTLSSVTQTMRVELDTQLTIPVREFVDEISLKIEAMVEGLLDEILADSNKSEAERQVLQQQIDLLRQATDPVLDALNSFKSIAQSVGVSI